MGQKLGAAEPLSRGEVTTHLTQCLLDRGLPVPSGNLIHPAVWPQ